MSESPESWEPVGTTLLTNMYLLGLLDTPEGFRVLVQDRKQPWFVYSVYGDVIYYQRNKALPNNSYLESTPPPDTGKRMLFRVQNSRLIQHLQATTDIEIFVHQPLAHYAFCLEHEERIDIVCRGELTIRMACNP